MRILLASILLFFSMAFAAAACPSWQLGGATYNFTGNDLYAPKNFGVQAGGQNSLSNCGLGNLGSGYFRSPPDYSFNLSGMEQYRLVVDVDAQCDSALLINTANAQWLFDDDSNGNLDPRIEITDIAQMNGRVDIWVGTYGGGSCNATLNLETFLAQAPAPAPTPLPVGCPDWNIQGAPITLAGGQLAVPQSYGVLASGSVPLANCGNIQGTGYFNQAPNFSFWLSGMDNYRLDLSVVSDCDSTLLANAVDTTWYFDDDSNGNLDPRLSIQGANSLNGRVDVWVGTYGGGSCNATLTAQAVPVVAPQPVPQPVPQPAGGCPTWQLQGTPITTTGDTLYSPQSYQALASGTTALSGCNIPGTRGYANAAPTYTFYLSGMDQYRLAVDVVSQCDSTLLVNTADGQWFFDDDSNGNLDPRLDIRGANLLNGRVDVWIGTYGGGSCNATLNMETWFN